MQRAVTTRDRFNILRVTTLLSQFGTIPSDRLGYGSSDLAISPYVHKRNTKNEIQQLKSNELTELVGIYFIINRLGLTVS